MKWFLATLACILLLGTTGCATRNTVDWDSRIGHYTYDKAVLELGPPDKSATLSDGSTVAEWLTHRGYSHSTTFYSGYGHGPTMYRVTEPAGPQYYLRLTFGPDKTLQDWQKVIR